MRRLLFMVILTFTLAILAETLPKAVVAWSYPEPSTNNVFKVYRTTDVPANPTRCWTVIKVVSGIETSCVVDLIQDKQNYFLVTVSNSWGESMFFQNRYITPVQALR